MKRLSIALIAFVISLILAPAAHADYIGLDTVGASGSKSASFNLQFSINSSGFIDAIQYGTVTFGSVGSTGVSSATITGLVTGATFQELANSVPLNTPLVAGNSNPGSYDQQVSYLSPFVDSYGLALTLSNGDELQIWYYSGNIRVSVEDSEGDQDTYHDPVSQLQEYGPEPSTLTLFGTGLLGLAALLRRKYAQSR